MAECVRCGVSDSEKKLVDAISEQGIVKICEDCLAIEDLPVIKKVEEQPEKQKSVRERLIGMNKKFSYGKEPTLRDLIDEKYKKNPQIYSDLIDNFHWEIQRARRKKKITREQFAKGIGESESTVRMIEQGILPEENYKIISRIEEFLLVNLRKTNSGFSSTDSKKFILDNSLIKNEKLENEKEQLGFDYNSVKKLKIGDLKKMKKKEREEEKEKKDVNWGEEWAEEIEDDDLL